MGIKFGQDETFDAWSQKIHEMMDQMLKRNFVDYRKVDAWKPAINVYESKDAFYICVELAGVDESAVEVECTEPAGVSVSGVRNKPLPDGARPLVIHAMEIDEGPFRREFTLAAPIDLTRIDAHYDKGNLWITAPKKGSER